jgi:hypothetical protein
MSSFILPFLLSFADMSESLLLAHQVGLQGQLLEESPFLVNFV